MSEYHESNGDPLFHQPESKEDGPVVLDLDPVLSDPDPTRDSPETPEWDGMGQNGAGIPIFFPSELASGQFQVQNPVHSPQEWDRMGQNGTNMGNSSPIVPSGSGPQASDSEHIGDEDDSGTTYPELVRGLLEFLGSSESEPEDAAREVVPLTERQLSAIPYLAAFPSVHQAARAAGIGKSTLYRWLEDDLFREELSRVREETAEFARQEAKGLMLRAVDVFRDAMNDSDVSVRMRAARYSLAFSSEVGFAEKLRREIDHLQTAVNEWMSRRPIS